MISQTVFLILSSSFRALQLFYFFSVSFIYFLHSLCWQTYNNSNSQSFHLLKVICNLSNYWLYCFCFTGKTQHLYCFPLHTKEFSNFIQYKFNLYLGELRMKCIGLAFPFRCAHHGLYTNALWPCRCAVLWLQEKLVQI